MKKSNALMFSYIAFLLISVIANFKWEWEGLDKIALAASIAGCFFALADLANWYVSYKQPFAETAQKDFCVLKDYCSAIKKSLQEEKKQAFGIIELLQPYIEKYEPIIKIIEACNECFPQFEERENSIKGYEESLRILKKKIDKAVQNVKLFSIIELLLAICGFISFFLITSFDVVVSFLSPYGSAATVIAFIIIMLNYSLRDVLEDKAKKTIDEVNERIEEGRKKIALVEEKTQEIKYLDSAKELVEMLKKNID